MQEYYGRETNARPCYHTLGNISKFGCNKIILPTPVTTIPEILTILNPHPYQPSCGCSSRSTGGCGCGSGGCGSGCGKCSHNSDSGEVRENFGAFSISAAVRYPYNTGNTFLEGVGN